MSNDAPKGPANTAPPTNTGSFRAPAPDMTAINEAYARSAGRVVGEGGWGTTGHGGRHMTPEQAAKSAADLIAAGMDPKTVRDAMAADGHTLPGAPGQDRRSDEAREFNASPMAGQSDPAAYTFALRPEQIGLDDELAAALGCNPAAGVADNTLPMKFNQAIREGFAAMGLPAALGSIAEMMAEASSPAAKAIERQHVRHQVEAVLGEGAAAEASKVLDAWRAKAPRLVSMRWPKATISATRA